MVFLYEQTILWIRQFCSFRCGLLAMRWDVAVASDVFVRWYPNMLWFCSSSFFRTWFDSIIMGQKDVAQLLAVMISYEMVGYELCIQQTDIDKESYYLWFLSRSDTSFVYLECQS
jgi:hypothetical protein